jgi:hypothetical protein
MTRFPGYPITPRKYLMAKGTGSYYDLHKVELIENNRSKVAGLYSWSTILPQQYRQDLSISYSVIYNN